MNREQLSEFQDTVKGCLNLLGMTGIILAWIWFPMLFPIITGYFLYPTIEKPIFASFQVPFVWMAVLGFVLLGAGIVLSSSILVLISIGYFVWSILADLSTIGYIVWSEQ